MGGVSLRATAMVRRLRTHPIASQVRQAVRMQKIVVLNPKGGSGKTTIAINLASYFALSGMNPTLMDLDAQGSSSRWLSKRAKGQPPIHAIAGYERNSRVTRSFATRVPPETQRLIVDTAAALEPQRLPELTRNATAVLVPVLPSDIDIHAAAKCISDLLLIAKIKREDQRIAVIANRVRKNTLVYKSLMRFLETLNIPVVATLRDSQNYVKAAESGTGIFEMKPYLVREDLEQWLPLLGWIAQRQPLTIAAGTPAITTSFHMNAGPIQAAAAGPEMPPVPPRPPVVTPPEQSATNSPDAMVISANESGSPEEEE